MHKIQATVDYPPAVLCIEKREKNFKKDHGAKAFRFCVRISQDYVRFISALATKFWCSNHETMINHYINVQERRGVNGCC